MRVYPECENALVRRSELARARQDTAAVYPYGKAKRLATLEGQNFAGQLGASVKRDGSLGRKLRANSVARNAPGSAPESSNSKAFPLSRKGSAASAEME